MKQTALYILFFGLIGLTSCQSDSVSMSEYYYPLKEIDDFLIYEYDRTDQFEQQIDSSKLYYKVLRLNSNRFAVVSLNDHFLSSDSLVLSLNNEALIMEEYYQWYSKGFSKSKTPRQVYYPPKLGLDESYSYNLEFDAVDSDRYQTERITETVEVVNIEPEKVTLQNEMLFEMSGIKTNDNSSNSTEYQIEFEKNQGMQNFKTISGTYETKFKLNRIWEPEQWKNK